MCPFRATLFAMSSNTPTLVEDCWKFQASPTPVFLSVALWLRESMHLKVDCAEVADSEGRGRTTSTFGHYCDVCHCPIGHSVCPNTPVSSLIYLQCRKRPSILVSTAVFLSNVHTSEVKIVPCEMTSLAANTCFLSSAEWEHVIPLADTQLRAPGAGRQNSGSLSLTTLTLPTCWSCCCGSWA